ncbi:MAG: glycosyltransferase family 9 protein [Bdellovibrionales bacterium]
MKKIHPEKPLLLICRRGLGQALRELGFVDIVIEINKGDRNSYKKALYELSQYEIINWVCPHNSFRSALFTWQVEAQNKVGYRQWSTQFFFDTVIQRDKRWPESIRLLQIWQNQSDELKKLLNELSTPDSWIKKSVDNDLQSPPIWADPFQFLDLKRVEKLSIEMKIQERYPFKNSIVLFPGSVWATKMWKKEKFASLGNEIQKAGHQVLIMGGPDEADLGKWVTSQVPGAHNLCGQSSILESLLLLRQQKLVIGNDSSSSHMAALMGLPVISFFGPTVLKFGYRPWAQKTRIFEVEGLKCRPCGAHGPKVCPLGHHRCMNDLNVELKNILSILS